jgi:hypothetical protein
LDLRSVSRPASQGGITSDILALILHTVV